LEVNGKRFYRELCPEHYARTCRYLLEKNGGATMRSGLLWLIGIPIPIILLIALFTGHL
jgi:hypothetical protein